MLLAFAIGLFFGAGLTVLLTLAGVGLFTLTRIVSAQREAKAREARIMAAVAREHRSPVELQPQPLAFQWLPKSRMD